MNYTGFYLYQLEKQRVTAKLAHIDKLREAEEMSAYPRHGYINRLMDTRAALATYLEKLELLYLVEKTFH